MDFTQKLASRQQDEFLAAHAFFSDPAHLANFERMVASLHSLQCWLDYYVTTKNFGPEVRAFFVEAMNDAIVAYSMSRVGTWRPAMQSLRSLIENTFVFLYYKDHPVELKLWELGRHRPGFSELCGYLKLHPLLSSFDHQSETGVVTLEEVYAKLSRAVHGSASFMRMTSMAKDEELPTMHVLVPVELSRFASIAVKAVESLNLLLVAIFREQLSGTALPLLRSSIASALSAKKCKDVKKKFGVTLH